MVTLEVGLCEAKAALRGLGTVASAPPHPISITVALARGRGHWGIQTHTTIKLSLVANTSGFPFSYCLVGWWNHRVPEYSWEPVLLWGNPTIYHVCVYWDFRAGS